MTCLMFMTGVCLILLTATVGVDAAEFSLQSEKTGKTYGPFTTENGSSVTLGKGKFVVISEKTTPSGTEEILKSVDLQQFGVLQASIDDAAAALTRKIRAHRSGIGNFTIVVKPRVDPRQARKDIRNDRAVLAKDRKITLELKDVTAIQALQRVANAYGYRMEITANTVTLHPHSP